MTDEPTREPDLLDRARTPLLTLITRESLDQDYVTVAKRGPRDPDAAPRSIGRVGVVAVVALFGVLVTVAGVQTSRNAAATDASRESLIERIEARREALRNAQARVADLRAENTVKEARLLEVNNVHNDVLGDLLALEGQTGFAPVSGEGIEIRLDNPELADENSMIRDSDLALLVNALWEAGAEAVSINNQRIAVVSAIRNVGPVVKINHIGLAPPYTILAIGDRSTLASEALLETRSGLAFSSLATQYGFTYTTDNKEEIQIPAAPPQLRRLRSAEQGSEQESEEDAGRDRLEGEGTS